ncbi:MAG TPA: hypothetical protein VMU56_08105 [Beijerinckiaceae bacterium]|nr:hypothetical protein [Beijerinckiaceae bacterium]
MSAHPHRTAKDEKGDAERKQRANETKEGSDQLSEALEDSFPASDPPSMTQPKTKAGAPKGNQSADQTGDSKR